MYNSDVMTNILIKRGLTVFLIAFCFVSCEKENEDPGKLLTGTWNQVSSKAIHYYDNVKISETSITFDPGESVLEIYENGTASRFHNGSLTSSYYWSIEGDILLITWDTGTVQKTGYSVDDATLILQWAVVDTSDGHIIKSEYEGVYKRK